MALWWASEVSVLQAPHMVLRQDMVSTPRAQLNSHFVQYYGDNEPYFIINVWEMRLLSDRTSKPGANACRLSLSSRDTSDIMGSICKGIIHRLWRLNNPQALLLS